jgi:hypothetical protein
MFSFMSFLFLSPLKTFAESPGDNVLKLFFFVTDAKDKYAGAFFPRKPYQNSQIIAVTDISHSPGACTIKLFTAVI